MDRRTFLKTLASLGVSISPPVDLVNAGQEDINEVWSIVAKAWDLFEVNAYGTLSSAKFREPKSRREIHWPSRAQDFDVNEVRYNCLLLRRIKNLYREELLLQARSDLSTSGIKEEDIEELVEDGWFEWFDQADGSTREAINAEIEAWLDEEPNWKYEAEIFYSTGTAQGVAYSQFLMTDPKMLEALGIEVIEGDCPCSSYFAAELSKPIDEANRIAEQNGWAIRFVAEGAA